MDDFHSKLYLEAHVTIDPIFDSRLKKARYLAKLYGFKVAELLMKKRKEDTPERSKYDTFMTGHGTSFADLKIRTAGLIQALQKHNFVVRRYKIEDTILDSRSNDIFGLLQGK